MGWKFGQGIEKDTTVLFPSSEARLRHNLSGSQSPPIRGIGKVWRYMCVFTSTRLGKQPVSHHNKGTREEKTS